MFGKDLSRPLQSIQSRRKTGEYRTLHQHLYQFLLRPTQPQRPSQMHFEFVWCMARGCQHGHCCQLAGFGIKTGARQYIAGNKVHDVVAHIRRNRIPIAQWFRSPLPGNFVKLAETLSASFVDCPVGVKSIDQAPSEINATWESVTESTPGT